MLSCEFFEFIKDNFFIKHLRATASECWRLEKSSWLLVEEQVCSSLRFLILIDIIHMDLLMGCRNFIFKLFTKEPRKSLEFSEIFALLSMVWFSYLIIVGKALNLLLTFVICMIFSIFFSCHFRPEWSNGWSNQFWYP